MSRRFYDTMKIVCVMLVICSSVMAESASSLINSELGKYFPEMHYQIAIDRNADSEPCALVVGSLIFTPRAARVLVFSQRGSSDDVAVEALTDQSRRVISLETSRCRVVFTFSLLEERKGIMEVLVPFDGSGIPGAEKKQVNVNKSVIEAAAYYPNLIESCETMTVTFLDDGAGIRFLTSGQNFGKIGMSKYNSKDDRSLVVRGSKCEWNIGVKLSHKDRDSWRIDIK